MSKGLQLSGKNKLPASALKTLAKFPAWFVSYQKKHSEIAATMPSSAQKIFVTAHFDELLQAYAPKETTTTATGAKIFSLAAALKDVKLSSQLKFALSHERAPQEHFAAFASSRVKEVSVVLVENDAEISVKVPKNAAHKQVVLVNTQKPVNILIEVSGEEGFFDSTIICPENCDVNVLLIPCMGGVLSMNTIVGENGVLHAAHAWLFGEKTRVYYNNILQGKNAKTIQSDLIFLNCSQEVHVAMSALHSGREGNSQTRVRCILQDNAKESFDGLIKILPSAQLTSSYLEVNSMLLSDNAKSTNIPKLEIEADDVKATHAATVEHLDEEKRFYLQSRGLSRSETESIIIASFLEGIVLDFPESIRSRIKELVANKLVTKSAAR